MTTAAFFENADLPAGFRISGHSTADASDETGRIFCAAVSSAAILAANTITEILRLDAGVTSKDGFLELRLTAPSAEAASIIAGLRLHLSELQKQYPDRINVISEV